ncbi:MAG: matrixin family metalloprotease [Longimicrobiales bacterium]
MPERNRNEVYDFRLVIGGDSLVLRWPNASRIRVYLNPATNPDLDPLLSESFRVGSTAWENAALYGDYQFAHVGAPEQADVIITWSGAVLPVETGQCPQGYEESFAFTTFCVTPERDRLVPFPLSDSDMASRVRFLVTIRESSATNATRVRSLVVHELGHVLGIVRHSPNSQDLMFADPSTRQLPNTRDRVTVQVLYQTTPAIIP